VIRKFVPSVTMSPVSRKSRKRR